MHTNVRARSWLALRSIEGVGDVFCRRLLERFGGADQVLRAGEDRLARTGLRPEIRKAILGFSRWADVEREIGRARDLGVDLLTIEDEGYPVGLRFIHDPPPVLYVKGALVPADVEAIAVVGSRAASAYGLAVAEAIGRGLGSAGVTVVSGMAVGVDGAAHRGALAGGGRTIAVLGCGIDTAYPSRHRRLAHEIASAGAVLSELPIGTAPEAYHFPRRNRLVAGLSLGVVVVEASERSGSLITARLALEQGREVLAVPGEVGLSRTRGTHRLIRQGARLVETAEDVIEDTMAWRSPERGGAARASAKEAISPDGSRILAAFEDTVEHVDRLIARGGFGAARTLEVLLELEMAGWIIRHPGMQFSRGGR